ncbi:hypothetical protein Tco_0576664 [Tanacetum coccineum]
MAITTTVAMITTNNRIGGKKPLGLILSTKGIVETFPYVKDAPCITYDLALSGVRLATRLASAAIFFKVGVLHDHSQKWHDGLSSRSIKGSSSEGIAAIVNKLENLGQDMKKLKENVHAIQVGCQNCGGAHLDKDCPLKEEVKSIEEAKYGEFGRYSPFSNGAKYRVDPPVYYTRMYNRPSFGVKRPSFEELMNKHLKESTRRRTKMEEWVKKLQENVKINTRNQSTSLKNLETQIEQLTMEFQTKATNDISSSSVDQCKAMYAKEKTPINDKQH